MSQMYDPSLNRIMLESSVAAAVAKGDMSAAQAAELLSGGAAAAAAVSSSTPGALAGVDVAQTQRSGKILAIVAGAAILYFIFKRR